MNGTAFFRMLGAIPSPEYELIAEQTTSLNDAEEGSDIQVECLEDGFIVDLRGQAYDPAISAAATPPEVFDRLMAASIKLRGKSLTNDTFAPLHLLVGSTENPRAVGWEVRGKDKLTVRFKHQGIDGSPSLRAILMFGFVSREKAEKYGIDRLIPFLAPRILSE